MNAKLRKLVDAVEEEMNNNAVLGANDTEPATVLQQLMVEALEGDVALPPNGEEWCLLHQTCGKYLCDHAAAELNEVVMPLVEFIAENRTSTRIQHDVRDYCWRI